MEANIGGTSSTMIDNGDEPQLVQNLENHQSQNNNTNIFNAPTDNMIHVENDYNDGVNGLDWDLLRKRDEASKLKRFFCNSLIPKFNQKIKEELNLTDQVMEEKHIKLYDIDAKVKSDPSIIINRELLGSQIGDFLATDVSSKYIKIPRDHNRILIQQLKEIPSLNNAFSLTYLECFRAFRGEILIGEKYRFLDGLEDSYGEYLEKLRREGYYEYMMDQIYVFVDNFERYFQLAHPRIWH